MKKLLLTAIIFTIFYLIFNISAHGQNTPNKNVKDTDERSQEIKERVLERIQEIKKTSTKQGLWGTIKEMDTNSLLVETAAGDRFVKIDEQIKVLLDQKNSKITDLAIGNFVIVMGRMDSTDSLEARRIVAFSKAPKPAPQRQAFTGKVVDISESENIIVVASIQKTPQTNQVKVTGQTNITKKTTEKIEKVAFNDIKANDQVVIVSIKGKEAGTITAKLIHVIPGKGSIQGKPKASPAPTRKPTTNPASEE